LEQIAVKTAAAVLYAAHFSKGNQAGKEAIDRISGSGVWTRDADSIITLTKHKEEGAYTVDLTLRNLPEQPPFVVQWDFPIMIERTEMLPSDLKQAKASKIKPKPTEHEFLSIFRETTNNPRGCLLTATELRGKFRERGWDEAYAPAMRDECEGAGKVKVNHGAHNQILTGLPGMVEAYRKQQTESCTILAQDPLPTKSKGTRRRK
jgi:hypothetical protein